MGVAIKLKISYPSKSAETKSRKIETFLFTDTGEKRGYRGSNRGTYTRYPAEAVAINMGLAAIHTIQDLQSYASIRVLSDCHS